MEMKSREAMALELSAPLTVELTKALNGDNVEDVSKAIGNAVTDYVAKVKEDLLKAFHEYQETQDTGILAARGIRQQTAEEKKFWTAFGEAGKTGNVKKAFTGIENAYPQTFIEQVGKNLISDFPLLNAINFQPGTLVTKVIRNAKAVQYASWKPITSALTEQIEGAIRVDSIENSKLYCVIPVSMDLIEAGPAWLERYVLAIMTEAIGLALCAAITTEGTGDGMPIAMNRDTEAAHEGDEYAVKTPIQVEALTSAALDTLYAELCEDATGHPRAISDVILVCNPKDYYRKVKPALTVLNAMGVYTVPSASELTVIQLPSIPQNRAILGLAKEYDLACAYGGKDGAVSASDEAKFLEDLRIYKGKLLAGGRPADDNAFLWLDITNLKPAALPVDVASGGATYPNTYKVRLTVAPKTVAKVAITDSNDESIGTCTVDTSTGVVDIPALASGSYKLTVSGTSYVTKTETFQVNGAALDLGTVTIVHT